MISQYIPKQALLLSESPSSLASLAVVLAQNEFSIHQAATVEDAVSAIETYSPSIIVAEQDVSDGTTAECIQRARVTGEPASIILISDLVDLKQMIRAINQNDVFQFLLRPFEDELIASIGDIAHKDYLIRTVQAQLRTTVSAYRQVNQVLEDQLNATHITGEYAPGIQLNLDGSVMGPDEATMAVVFLELANFDQIYQELGLERAGEILRSIMTHIHEVIHQHQGYIDKHLKEGLVFFFPIEGENMLSAAVEALEGICNEFESLASLSELQGLHLNIGAGFGKVMQVPIGSYQHQEVSLIGEPVNLAARLMEYSQFITQNEGAESKRFTVLTSRDFIDHKRIKPFEIPQDSWIRDFASLREVARLDF
jgi:class 3 adenylate cyclase